MRHTHGILACLLMLATGIAQPANRANEKQEELRALRNRIEALQRQLAESEGSHSEAVDALRDSERAISDLTRKLRGLAVQSRDAGQRLAELRAQTTHVQGAIKEQREVVARLLFEQYIGGGIEPLRLLLNRENPNRIARDLHYLSYVSRARIDLLAELRVNLVRLEDLAEKTKRQAAEIAAIVTEQTAQKRQLEREKQARSGVLAKISRDIRQQRREIGTLQRDEHRLARLVHQLRQIVTRERPSSPQPPTQIPRPVDEGGPFDRLKGRLSLPVRGELANRFGSPRSGGAMSWKGLFIAATAGDEVRAIARGRVVFADWLRGFGNLLIIDHGDAYMSLYGNNETLLKGVGDFIRGGEPVARVGNSGGNVDSGLYFELRYQGTPLDPLVWVGTP